MNLPPKPINGKYYNGSNGPRFWAPILRPGKGVIGANGLPASGDVTDITQNIPPATRLGPVTWGVGPYGPELQFAGGTSFAYITDVADYPPLNTPQVTWHAVVMATSFPNPYNCVFSDEGPISGLTLLVKSTGKLAIYASGTTGGAFNYDGTGTFTLSLNTYYILDLVFDGTTMSGYVNGNLDHSVSAAGNLQPTASHFYIGARAAANDRNWVGSFLDMAIYTRGLSASEIYYNTCDPWWRLRDRTHFAPIAAPIAAPPSGGPYPFHTDNALAGGLSSMGI